MVNYNLEGNIKRRIISETDLYEIENFEQIH